MITSVKFMRSVAASYMIRDLPDLEGYTSIRLPPNAKCMISAT